MSFKDQSRSWNLRIWLFQIKKKSKIIKGGEVYQDTWSEPIISRGTEWSLDYCQSWVVLQGHFPGEGRYDQELGKWTGAVGEVGHTPEYYCV